MFGKWKSERKEMSRGVMHLFDMKEKKKGRKREGKKMYVRPTIFYPLNILKGKLERNFFTKTIKNKLLICPCFSLKKIK